MSNGISLSGIKQHQAARKSAANIAKQQRKAQRKRKKRGFFGKLLKGGLKLGLGALKFAGPMGFLASSALSYGGGKLIDRALAGVKGLKTGAHNIKGDKYGYGDEQAKTIREGLREQDELEQGVSLSGLAGSLATDVIGQAAKQGITTFGGLKQLGAAPASSITPTADTASAIKGFTPPKIDVAGTTKLGSTATLGASGVPSFGDAFSSARSGGLDTFDWQGKSYTTELAQGKHGGEVIMQPPNAPTIAEYFGMQGKTLSGNNIQSIAQMLGRK